MKKKEPTQPQPRPKAKKNHPWRGSFEHGKRQNDSDLHYTRISTFNRMGVRL